MRILWHDYETYFDNDYSLKKMTRTEYINDARFQAHGCVVAIDDAPFQWVEGRHLQQYFGDMRDHFDAYAAHNAPFDCYITHVHFLKDRKFIIDTQAMAQIALFRRCPGLRRSLDALAKYYWPEDPRMWKIGDVLHKVNGMRTEQIPSHLKDELTTYALQDGHVLRELFKKLLAEPEPWDFLLHDISLTTAMGVYPQMEMDIELAAAINRTEVKEKEDAVKDLNIDRSVFRSNEKTAALYRSIGIEPPTKVSKTTGEITYAFAQNDIEFMELLDHPDPRVRAITELRIGEKSAQVMNRSAVFAKLPRKLPVPLKVSAAHTGRMGGDEYNLQNLERGSKLRQCIRAPKGYKLVACDSSQVELRGTAWFCGEQTVLDILAAGGSVYAQLGTSIFGYEVTKKEHEFVEYYAAKQTELACQYGVGADRLLAQLRKNGMTTADMELAEKLKAGYRRERKAVVKMWRWLNDVALPAIAGLIPSISHKGFKFEQGRVVLPSGRSMWYPQLHVNEKGDWVYMYVNPKGVCFLKKIYGAALLENLIQGICYDGFMWHARKTDVEVGPMAMPVHDEGVYCVPDELVDWVSAQLLRIEATNPPWWPDIQLKGEVGFGQTYLEAK